MKPSFAEYILGYAAGVFMLALVFHSSLGLPNYLGDVFLMAFAVCLFLFWRAFYRRAQAHPGTLPPYSDILNRWMLPVIAIGFLCGVAAFCFEIFYR